MNNLVIPGGRRALPTPLTQAEKNAIAGSLDPRINALEALNTGARLDQREVMNSINTDPLSTVGPGFRDMMNALKPDLINRLPMDVPLTLDTQFSTRRNIHIDFLGTSGSGGRQTINVADADTASSRPGGWRVPAFASFKFFNIDFNITTNRNPLGIFEVDGIVRVRFESCTFGGAGTSCLLSGGFSTGVVNAHFQNSPVTNITGEVFNGVAAGSDPRAAVAGNYITNLRSA